MLIRAMVREKLGSPRSSPKKSRNATEEEFKSPAKFKTPLKRKFSPFRMLQRNDVDFGNLHTPQKDFDQSGDEFFSIKPKLLCTDVKPRQDGINPLLKNTAQRSQYGGTSKKSDAMRSRIRGTLSMASFDINKCPDSIQERSQHVQKVIEE